MPSEEPNKESHEFASKKVFLMVLLYRVVGISNTLVLPQIALNHGALGCILFNFTLYIVLGIPVVYMELIISQFTGRDCIDMWKIRPCLSHVGYFVQGWQFIVFIYNHSIVSILFHYLIVSFENPPPYSRCGKWSTQTCNMVKNNYTANQRCIREKESYQDCDDLYLSYPEYQYYVNNLFEGKKHTFFVSWSICVSSTVIIIIIFFQCFRRIRSIKWFIYPMSFYPIIAYLLLMIGSMRQKGLILYIGEALDTEFETFASNFRPTALLLQTLYSVGAGSGVISNLAAQAPFRSPCYSNAITVVLTSAIVTTVAITTSAMMACPYAFEYGGSPSLIINHPVSFAFIKLPKMINEYSHSSWWLVIAFSTQCVLGIRSNIVILYTMLEIAAKRYPKVRQYSAVSTLVTMILIFVFTIPLLGNLGKDIIGTVFRKCIFLVSMFFVTMECIVFMLWYGMDKFYEDIHFMQGVQPRSCMKASWIILSFVLMYLILQDLVILSYLPKSNSETFGFVLMLAVVISPIVICFVKLLVAAARKKFSTALNVDPLWGPQDEVLRRSRAMFTAHAMTKEYMYRQYHLQAGIVARQQVSNARAPHLTHVNIR